MIEQINGKNYISVYNLRKLGFNYPAPGTPGLWLENLFGYKHFTNWYRFHAVIQGSGGGIYVSPWLTDVGKKLATEGEFFVEFSPQTFTYNPQP